MTGASRHSWIDVRDTLRARILSRAYAPGDKFPKDIDLAEEFGCARTTVHRAMQDLAAKGLVERKRKGGTHVRADPVTRATFDIPITRLEIEQRGGTHAYQMISQTMAKPPKEVLERFGVDRQSAMMNVKALHLADNTPYILEDRWIDTQTCADILHVDLSRESANEWLVHNKPYSRVDVRFFAKNAGKDSAKHLATKVGEALLVIERTTWIGSDPITTVLSSTAPGYKLSAQN